MRFSGAGGGGIGGTVLGCRRILQRLDEMQHALRIVKRRERDLALGRVGFLDQPLAGRVVVAEAGRLGIPERLDLRALARDDDVVARQRSEIESLWNPE